MPRAEELAIAIPLMIPFIACYLAGVAVKIGRDNKDLPQETRTRFCAQVVGEAVPGLLESIVTLTAVFGVVVQASQSESSLFQSMGLVASAAFLAFRGGYTYQESLISMSSTQRTRRTRKTRKTG